MTNADTARESLQSVMTTTKAYIMETFLPGENPDELTSTTPLITGGILDSLATIKLVGFLEERYTIRFEAHETMVDYLDTLQDISQLVCSKL